MFNFKALLIFVSVFICHNEAARILAMFPTPSISHQVVFRPLTQELARRGHEVLVITTDPVFTKENAHKNLTEIDVRAISYKYVKALQDLATGEEDNLRGQIYTFFNINVKLFEVQFSSDEVQKIIKDKHKKNYLLLLEACVRPTLALTHIYKVPTILVSSFGPFEMNNYVMGTPTHPILYPTLLHQRLYNLTLWEKIIVIYKYIINENIIKSHESVENKSLKKLIPDIPPLSELANNVDMLFLNTHPIWEGNRPVPPSVVFLGGLHQNPEKKLPEELQSYLDSSKQGVIYMSFGTNVQPSLISPTILQAFVNVFAKLPYNVLWKFDKDEIPGLSSNVKLSKWFPQSDLLRHPNIKVFITQGGLQSTDEAITAGVPLIGVPMLGDQWFNTEKYEYHKIGLKLNLEIITEERLYNGIKTVVEDESYRHNIVRLRSLLRDQPQSPLERAVWWTEHVLRHGGGPHLRAPAANISWRHFLELDVVLILMSALMIAVAMLLITLYYLFRLIRSSLFVVKIKKL